MTTRRRKVGAGIISLDTYINVANALSIPAPQYLRFPFYPETLQDSVVPKYTKASTPGAIRPKSVFNSMEARVVSFDTVFDSSYPIACTLGKKVTSALTSGIDADVASFILASKIRQVQYALDFLKSPKANTLLDFDQDAIYNYSTTPPLCLLVVAIDKYYIGKLTKADSTQTMFNSFSMPTRLETSIEFTCEPQDTFDRIDDVIRGLAVSSNSAEDIILSVYSLFGGS